MGGASMSDSVDLSATYLGWARKNLALNGLSDVKHRTHQADVREWLKDCEQQYDLVLLDPPTFSNSKRMDGTLDILRDHVELIEQVMARLSPSGLLIFSNNHRRFSLADEVSERFAVEDKTQWSLDKDFQRSQKIHQCWFIRHR
jgi:23S rRNA (guanine2445-N2)-methyltransferase / 23S rRNA (guanine2069-N7)-methyltransferase